MIYQTPDRLLIGGCSFTVGSSSVANINQFQQAWPDYLVCRYPIQIINNFAMNGGGNIAMIQNLTFALEKDSTVFPPDKTLILFNITGLERIDLMVSGDHPDINRETPWNDHMPFSWITSGGWFGYMHLKSPRWPPIGVRSGHAKQLIDTLQKNQEYEQIVLSTCLALINFIMALQARGYRYYFMIMDDQILLDAPEFFIQFLHKQEQKWIRFGQYLSMHSYAESYDALKPDNFHPSVEGHKKIADKIMEVVGHHFT